MYISTKQVKALTILRDNPNITANRFAYLYFNGTEKKYLLTSISNQGNGACPGKKAWLCAGSYLGKLARLGYVQKKTYSGPTRFSITEKGEKELSEHDEILKTLK